MNILDFDKWSCSVSEGIDVKVTPDNDDSKDDITIGDTTYTVDDDIIQNGSEQIEDKKLKEDIKDAAETINILNNTKRTVEIRRITGGDKYSIKDTINKYLKDDVNIMRDETLMSNDDINKFFKSKSEPYKYVDINYDHYTNNNIKQNIIDIYNTTYRGIGKGEYFLPLLYHDIYKKKAYIEVGDNYIINGENEYNLELKGSNINLKFDKDSKKRIKESNNNIEILKDEITTSFLKYAIGQSKKRKNLYMCIFDVVDIKPKDKEPKGMLFINISNIGDTKENDIDKLYLFKVLRNMISIVESDNNVPRDGYDFKYNIKKEGEKIKIECILNERFLNESNSIILSRDNFINEIYTK